MSRFNQLIKVKISTKRHVDIKSGRITCRDEALQRHGSYIMYKQRTNSQRIISLIELKVYHSKIRRTESYSRYIVNLKRIVVEFDETNNISENELESPREQLGPVSQPPLVLPLLAFSFRRDLLLDESCEDGP